MPPYKVHVTKAIWTDENRADLFDNLYYDLELPFVPFLGLALQQEGWYCGPIERITWDGDRQLFRAESRDEAPSEDDDFTETAEDMRDRNLRQDNWRSHKMKG
jgi:hypothetical protein